MALQKQVVPVEIATGIDTKTDPKKVTGKLISLINAVFRETRALIKRNGYQAYPQTILNGSSIASGATISPYQNELALLDGKNLYSYSTQQSSWVNKGTVTPAALSVSSIVKNSRGQTTQDQANHPSGFQVFTWEDTAGGTYYSVIDTSTGQTIVNSVLISATAYMAKPMVVGNYVVVFYFDSVSTSLRYQAINMSTPTAIGGYIVVSASLYTTGLVSNTCTYDVCVNGTNLNIVYNKSSGFAAKSLSSSLTLSGESALTGGGPNVACFSDASNNMWLAWYDLTNIKVAIYSSSFASVLASTIVENTSGTLGDAYYLTRNLTGIVIGTVGHIFYESNQKQLFLDGRIDAFYGNYIRTNTITLTGTVGTPTNVIRSLGIASKPFVYSSQIYMLGVYDAERKSYTTGLLYDESFESTYFLVSLSGEIVSKIAQTNGGGISKKFIAPEAVQLNSNQFQLSYLFKDRLVSDEGAIYTLTGVNAGVIDFTQYALPRVEMGKTLLIGGGDVRQYDGATPTELNFQLFPELLTYWTSLVGGASAPGSYAYKGIYEWTDNQGQINRSATSDTLTVKTADVQISVVTTSGSTQLNVNDYVFGSNNTVYKVALGFAVNGANIPAGTYVTAITYGVSPGAFAHINMSNAATATVAEETITITPQLQLQAYQTTDLLKTISFYPITRFLVGCHVPPSSSVVYISDISNLVVGMSIGNNPILSIDPLTHIVTFASLSFPPGDSSQYVTTDLQGTFTSGSATVTSVISSVFPALQVGQTINGPGGGIVSTIASFNASAGTVTLTAPYAGGTTTNAGSILMPAGYALKSGQSIAGPGIQANTYLDTVTIVQPSTTNATISLAANSTQTNQVYNITNMYANMISMPTIRATNKSAASLALYRTQSNLTNMYRVTPISQPVLNSTTTDIAYIYDSVSDFNLIGNEQLYTDGGEVDNASPPATTSMTTYKNRTILVPSEAPFTWWFSKQVIPGSPVEFSQDFVENIDPLGGPITAVASMDDKLVLFKETNIFYLVGEGPTPSGAQNDFSEAQLISSDTGCDNPSSVVLTPDGLMFQSGKGIYLLSRNLQVQYIGAEVEAYLSDRVTSAKLLADAYQVRFTLNNSIALVYDYSLRQWSVFTNVIAVDSCTYNNIYHYLTAAGVVNKETPGQFTDNGAFIPMSLTTSWMSFAGLQGFQRIWRLQVLGKYKSPHTLDINVASDFATSFDQNVVIPVTSDPGVYQYRVHLKKQKCQAMQFQIQDSQTSSFGEGLELSEITLEVGLKVGGNKLPAGKSF